LHIRKSLHMQGVLHQFATKSHADFRVLNGKLYTPSHLCERADGIINPSDIKKRRDFPDSISFATNNLSWSSLKRKFRCWQGLGSQFIFKTMNPDILQLTLWIAKLEIKKAEAATSGFSAFWAGQGHGHLRCRCG